MNKQQLRGLTPAELTELRASLVLFGLDKIATVRVHTQRYAFGYVDIRPTKRAYHQSDCIGYWTQADFVRMHAFMQTTTLISSLGEHSDDVAYACNGNGFSYMGKEI